MCRICNNCLLNETMKGPVFVTSNYTMPYGANRHADNNHQIAKNKNNENENSSQQNFLKLQQFFFSKIMV